MSESTYFPKNVSEFDENYNFFYSKRTIELYILIFNLKKLWEIYWNDFLQNYIINFSEIKKFFRIVENDIISTNDVLYINNS